MNWIQPRIEQRMEDVSSCAPGTDADLAGGSSRPRQASIRRNCGWIGLGLGLGLGLHCTAWPVLTGQRRSGCW
jgi:hypothetical protein